MNNLGNYWLKLNVFIMSLAFHRIASAEVYSLPGDGGDDTLFGPMYEFLDEMVGFVSGPVVLAITFFSIVAVVGLWMLAPKAQGVMGWAMRVALGAIIILNISAWMIGFDAY